MSPSHKLWAPWRMAFIKSEKTGGCVFCPEPSQGLKDSLIVCERALAFVILNKYPYTSSHLMVAPRKHTSKLDELTQAESSELFALVQLSIRILRDEINPEGFNVGMNIGRAGGAGITEHIHMHVVPRWNGDTNFMPVLADTSVIPQHLSDTYDNLRARFLDL